MFKKRKVIEEAQDVRTTRASIGRKRTGQLRGEKQLQGHGSALIVHDVSRERVLQALIESGALTAETAIRARQAADRSGDSVIATLSLLGLASEETVADTISKILDLSRVARSALWPATLADQPLSLAYLKRQRIVPIRDPKSNVLSLAMADATDEQARKAIELFLGQPVAVFVALATDVESVLDRLASEEASAALPSQDRSEEIFLGGLSELDRLREAASDAPVIRFVNAMLASAVDERASDVHIEPTADGLMVRFRIDGRLRARDPSPPGGLRDAIVSRIKLMASLDIAERRLPQDGRISQTVRGEELDFRVATAPTGFGESIVIRVLDRAQIRLDFADLGFDALTSASLRAAFVRPNGMVLVTGPTGSGKTTTLYAALAALNSPEFKLMSVEDPIEYLLPGVQQVQVNPAIGLTFARALRSFLRHNPNVVMVGEIRDLETAEIAIQVALTGHLLLSTLHTNDAASAVARLLDIGVEDYLIASTLNAVVAQRLVRKLCPHCKRTRGLAPQERRHFGPADVGKPVCDPVGCPQCSQTGFAGRTTIAEILPFSHAVRELTLRRSPTSAILETARGEGMRPMFEDGVAKVAAGLTTFEEVLGAVQTI